MDGVRRLNRGLRLSAQQVERRTGLSAAQLFVLEHLGNSPAISLNDLALRTLTDRSSVSAVVDRLAKRGLVERRVFAGDRRQLQVHITRAGVKVRRSAPLPPGDLILAALARMSRATVTRLSRAFSELNDALGFHDPALLFEDEL